MTVTVVSSIDRELNFETYPSFESAVNSVYLNLQPLIESHDEYSLYQNLDLASSQGEFTTEDESFALNWDKTKNNIVAYSNLNNMQIDYQTPK